MSDSPPQTIYLNDYRPFPYDVQSVHLTFDLAPSATLVRARIRFAPKAGYRDPEFFLHGEGLTLLSAKIDGEAVMPECTPEGLRCSVPDVPFIWEAVVQINPATNTALEGLYVSKGMYCTQCEAEGFRKITYYPDRPDVMSTFTVRINGPHKVLLSNGNPIAQGDGWAEWHDPWPKPAYLFALVAGDLVAQRDRFVTMEGRAVDLAIYVRPGDENKCAFAMQALKASMKWDEEVYGRAYDLDVFNIVAVDDFNMGAMENKGLNIFNAAAVLASPATSTDMNFERIESIIAHEYFHNWTGNRITCRDWFQLCLKEGLTVYRDAQFTADMRSAPVKRIMDVIDLRARQFPQDQGPLAHPVRPDSFQEINNFYTATVYEKGAEVIGMLRTLIGADAYSAALDLYFQRHDGQAATIEDWLRVFEDTTGRDLSQFKRWYTQAGTPELRAECSWHAGTLTLTFHQDLRPSATTPDPQPQVIPIALGLIGADGREVMETQVLEMTQKTQSFTFSELSARPVPSILRGFSAPVVLRADVDHAHLLAYDTDPFNRWEAGHEMARSSVLARIRGGAPVDGAYVDGIACALRDETLDPAFRALMLNLPDQSQRASELAAAGEIPDPIAIWQSVQEHKDALAQELDADLPGLFQANAVVESYAPNAAQSGRRALQHGVLGLLTRLDRGAQAQALFDGAHNMTAQLAGLACLIRAGCAQGALSAFEEQWSHDRLVMDKWFALQISQAEPDDAVDIAQALSRHSAFDPGNPNRFRAVLGALSSHHAGFHAADGSGYRMLADWLIRLDPVNPQTAARMASAFQSWRRYDPIRQSLIGAELGRIMQTPELSRDMHEMVGRIQNA